MVEATTFSEAGGQLVNEDAFLVQQHPGETASMLRSLGVRIG